MVAAITLVVFLARGEMNSGQALVHALSGDVSISAGRGIWQKLDAPTRLDRGTLIKTGADSTVDLVLGYHRTVLRLTPNSVLRLVQLDQEIAGEDFITETKLELISGALAGSQRKLPPHSHLEITTPTAVARIKGTEYYVSASGAVSVVSGVVSIHYNLPGNGGSVKATIPAGYSFNPATMTVVPTTPALLQNIIAHIITTRNNAETFKANGATIVVKPKDDDHISPSHPGDDDHGDDGHGGHGDDGHGNDGHGISPGNPGGKKP